MEGTVKKLTHEDVSIATKNLSESIKKDYGESPIIYPVPRGGVPVAYLISKYFHLSRITDNINEATIILDDIIDSGSTQKNYEKYNLPFYSVFNKQEDDTLRNKWVVFPWEDTIEKSIEDTFKRLIQYCGEDPNREGLLETPKRMAKAWSFWTQGYGQDPKEVFKTFKDGGESYDEMILISPIPFYSHCEHHMAAIFGEVYIAYIPNGKIAGLSKFARLVDIFSRRLQVQERLTTQISELINEQLSPKGVAVLIKARHFCMESRGVQKSGVSTITSSLKGIFLKETKVREEFLSLIRI